jgi:hypothetical protein
MFFEESNAKCQAVIRVTNEGVHRCLKPANVISAVDPESTLVLCLEHSRKLIHELTDSVRGGAQDAACLLAARKRRAGGR